MSFGPLFDVPPKPALLSTEPSSGDKSFARNPPGIFGCQERCHRRHVLRLADAAQRRLRFNTFLKVATKESSTMRAFGFNHAGIDGIHPHIFWPQFLCKGICYRIHRGLGGTIDRRVWQRIDTDDGADVNHAAASGIKLLHSRLRRENQA